jgi:hypothetical protein
MSKTGRWRWKRPPIPDELQSSERKGVDPNEEIFIPESTVNDIMDCAQNTFVSTRPLSIIT